MDVLSIVTVMLTVIPGGTWVATVVRMHWLVCYTCRVMLGCLLRDVPDARPNVEMNDS